MPRYWAIVLNPERRIGGLDAESYRSVLGWALSRDDLSELDGIRSRGHYWEKLSTALAK